MKNIKLIFASIRYSLRLFRDVSPKFVIGKLIISFVLTAVPFIQTFVNKEIVDSLSQKELKFNSAIVWIIIIIASWVFMAISQCFKQNANQISYSMTKNIYDKKIMTKASNMSVEYLESQKGQEEIGLAQDNSDIYIAQIDEVYIDIVFVIFLFASLVTLFFIEPLSAAAFTVLAVIGVIVFSRWEEVEYLNYVRNIKENRQADYISGVISNQSSLKEIKSYDLFSWLFSKYSSLSEIVYKRGLKMYFDKNKSLFIYTVFSYIVKSTVWIYVIYRAVNGNLDAGQVLLFMQLWDVAYSKVFVRCIFSSDGKCKKSDTVY